MQPVLTQKVGERLQRTVSLSLFLSCKFYCLVQAVLELGTLLLLPPAWLYLYACATSLSLILVFVLHIGVEGLVSLPCPGVSGEKEKQKK